MTLKRTEQLLKILRAHGVSHFKTLEVEVRIDVLPPPNPLIAVGSASLSDTKAPPSQAAPPVDMNIPHHVNEVAKLLKLGDAELVDALFPEPKPEKAE